VNTGGICNDEEAYNSMRDLTDENFKAAFELPLRRTDNLQFTVHHYAADIKYTMTDFCAKSKDELDDFVADTLRTGSVFVKVRCICRWCVPSLALELASFE
jgi:myosin heavy subunit